MELILKILKARRGYHLIFYLNNHIYLANEEIPLMVHARASSRDIDYTWGRQGNYEYIDE
jgi:hypothetical protein